MILRNHPKLLIAAALVFAVLVILAIWQGGLFQGGNASASEPPRVQTIVAKQEDALATSRSFTGRVEARREAAAGFELGGLVSRVMVEEGDRVRRGQPLARLDTAILRARRVELTSALAQAAADQALAQSTLDRLQAAMAREAVSAQAVDEAERTLKAAQAAHAQSSAAISSLDVRIGKSTLRAPFNAVVTSRLVDEGAVVANGAPIIGLIESDALEVRVGVTGAAVQQLSTEQVVNINVRDARFSGVIKAILPLRDRNTRSVDVIISLPSAGTSLRHGDLARFEVELERAETGIWLPLTALTEGSRGIWAVYVANPDSDGIATLERRQIQVVEQDTDRVFVRGTLKAGDRVVSAGLHRISAGLRVQTNRTVGAVSAANEGADND